MRQKTVAEFSRRGVSFGWLHLEEISWDSIRSWLHHGTTLTVEGVAYDQDSLEDLRKIWLRDVHAKISEKNK